MQGTKKRRRKRRRKLMSKYSLMMLTFAIFRVPFEKKVQFTEKVRRLTNEGLTRLVKRVKEICPQALEDVNDEKLHIKVDDIEREAFEKLDLLVDENLKTTKGGDTAASGVRKK